MTEVRLRPRRSPLGRPCASGFGHNLQFSERGKLSLERLHYSGNRWTRHAQNSAFAGAQLPPFVNRLQDVSWPFARAGSGAAPLRSANALADPVLTFTVCREERPEGSPKVFIFLSDSEFHLKQKSR